MYLAFPAIGTAEHVMPFDLGGAGEHAMVKVVCQDAVKTLHFAHHAAFMAAICSGVIVSMPSS